MRFTEFKITDPVELAIQEHIKKGVPFSECIFRPGSTAFTEFYKRVREMRESLSLDWQDQELLDTDIGECITVEGELVPLDVPIEEEDKYQPHMMYKGSKSDYRAFRPRTKKHHTRLMKTGYTHDDPETKRKEVSINTEAEYQGKKVKLNSPKRGGSKKFYVYVKNPKTGRVKKISWGDTTGLSVKAKNRGAVRSFVARHKCKQANDKMTARYWSCRTPRYKALGVKGGQWW